jgi:hypothetical protein
MELGCGTRFHAARLAQRVRRQAGLGILGLGVSQEFAVDRVGRTSERAKRMLAIVMRSSC